MTTIIVFGGSGFIGGHLLRYLSMTTDADILSVDINPPKMRIPRVRYLLGDVRDLSNFDIADEILTIYNLAAVHTTPGHAPYEYYETNVAGATQITAFARRKGIRDIVFTSSISVYGSSDETKTEKSLQDPESDYGWSKWLAECIHRTWLAEDNERRLVIVRPAVIFGPGEGGNFSRLAKILKRGYFVYPGRTDTVKACFYVDDLIDAIMFARERSERYILFNGCYPDRYTIGQIVEAMRAVHFSDARTFILPRAVVIAIATMLRPFAVSGLGIHPDRIFKLVRPTDILPGWLDELGVARSGALTSAIERWKVETEGRFD